MTVYVHCIKVPRVMHFSAFIRPSVENGSAVWDCQASAIEAISTGWSYF